MESLHCEQSLTVSKSLVFSSYNLKQLAAVFDTVGSCLL